MVGSKPGWVIESDQWIVEMVGRRKARKSNFMG
jgi:hypothetical protein